MSCLSNESGPWYKVDALTSLTRLVVFT